MWKPTVILAVLAAFLIGSLTSDSIRRPAHNKLPFARPALRTPHALNKLPFALQHPRYPRGIYDPPPYTYEGDVPKAPLTVYDPFLPSIIDDVKDDPTKITARSVKSVLKPMSKDRRLEVYRELSQESRVRKVRDLRLPGPDYEVPRVPRIPAGRYPWQEEQFDRAPRFPRFG